MNRFCLKKAKRILFFITIIFLITAGYAPAYGKGTSESLYQAAKKDSIQLKQSKNKQKYRDKWERVINGYIRVTDLFPKSNRADDALYNAGMATLKLRKISRATRDTEAALEIFNRLARDYPQSRYADDAQYMIGEINRTIKKSPEEAYRAYALVPELFPRGDMVGKAKERLMELPKPAAPPPAPVSMRVKKFKNKTDREVHVLGIRHWAGSDYVRVVIDLDGPVDFEEHRLPDPDRIYVDLKNTRISKALQESPILVPEGYLKKIRAGQYAPHTARVVIDFDKIRNVSVFTLTGPDRIVMDVAGVESRSDKLSRIRQRINDTGSQSLSLSEQLGMKVSKVVIDAGHGGKDPGCIGKSGTKEKEITLDVSRRLKKLLEEKLDLEVVMTRDRDIYIPLDERTAIANREKADLFISVHVNAAKNRSLRGVETWFLDLAASERAKKIAARENLYFEKPSSDLEFILNDLLVNNKTQESSRLAEMLQISLTSNLRQKFKDIESHGVKGAPFVVLVGARMPSVLSEVSFLSNPTEEKRLKKTQYRQDIALGLFNGVRRFVQSSEYAYSGNAADHKSD